MALGIDGGHEMIVVGRPEKVAGDVLLTRPDELDRVVHTLGDRNRLLHGIRLQSSAVAATDILIVYGDFFRRKAGQSGRRCDDERRHLRADPDFAAVLAD